jgi:hypothetical protein
MYLTRISGMKVRERKEVEGDRKKNKDNSRQ